jgi:hypothetical protein
VIGNTSSFEKRYGGVIFLPMTFFLDREGKVIAREIGVQKPQRLRGAHKKILGSETRQGKVKSNQGSHLNPQ